MKIVEFKVLDKYGSIVFMTKPIHKSNDSNQRFTSWGFEVVLEILKKKFTKKGGYKIVTLESDDAVKVTFY